MTYRSPVPLDNAAAAAAIRPALCSLRNTRWTDYLALLKPRVMSLVVFTALTGLLCSGARIGVLPGAMSVVAIALGAGGAGALNMWYDADIDQIMRRTASRPIPMGRLNAETALHLGLALSIISVMTLALVANVLAASLLAFTIFFYAVVYTMVLKRRTPQNIVIGGAAGALPPVVGWAAASGHAPLNAWLLFALIFLWTPPHFWALALCRSDDFAKAGIPMMPVVRGAAVTRRLILVYAVLFVLSALAPILTSLGGPIYALVSVAGGCVFLVLSWKVFRSRAGETTSSGTRGGKPGANNGAPKARRLFAYSILYLTLLFAALLVDHGVSFLHWR